MHDIFEPVQRFFSLPNDNNSSDFIQMMNKLLRLTNGGRDRYLRCGLTTSLFTSTQMCENQLIHVASVLLLQRKEGFKYEQQNVASERERYNFAASGLCKNNVIPYVSQFMLARTTVCHLSHQSTWLLNLLVCLEYY